jgi:hypothetical protein
MARGWAGDRTGMRCRGSRSALGRERASGYAWMRCGTAERWIAPSVVCGGSIRPSPHGLPSCRCGPRRGRSVTDHEMSKIGQAPPNKGRRFPRSR